MIWVLLFLVICMLNVLLWVIEYRYSNKFIEFLLIMLIILYVIIIIGELLNCYFRMYKIYLNLINKVWGIFFYYEINIYNVCWCLWYIYL